MTIDQAQLPLTDSVVDRGCSCGIAHNKPGEKLFFDGNKISELFDLHNVSAQQRANVPGQNPRPGSSLGWFA